MPEGNPNLSPATRFRCMKKGSSWARWRVEHPGEDPDMAGLKVMLISWLDPQPNAA
jgi:hypothetical protein